MAMSLTMVGETALIDASSYMLVEAIGDSDCHYYDTAEQARSTAEDDAESCTCTCTCAFVSHTSAAAHIDDDFDELEDGVVDQCNSITTQKQETDRLFWEACLAS
ncbi:hypothetical protein AAHA92_10008 [Salvia divinorum]|uniref:Uncharacterized protein n=1 Tax=Salvia divinorum TaxID=28513 RepID=A0ABD1HUW0_SALDI